MECPDPEVLGQLGAGALGDVEVGALLDHAASCAECHAAVIAMVGAPEPDAAPLECIDRYQLHRIVGRGAMGVVYAAFDPELGREVAVKVLRPNASADRLRREAQALARLTHPNVVRVYDVGDHEGKTFIAMELVDGENLRAWLRTAHSFEEILRVLVEAGRGLAAAHRAGLVHRDFKPDNVLIAKTGGVLVGDFGLARSADTASLEDPQLATTSAVSHPLTATGATVGTPAYMAPEQRAGEASSASDQYAFCVTAWEACFGQRPAAAPTTITRSVPRRVESALRRGLDPQAGSRFPTMDALLRALEPPSRRRWPWIAGGALVVIIATTVIARTALSPARSEVRCDDAGAVIASAWTPAIESQLTKRWGPGLAHAFGRYADGWRQQRIDRCRATHERGEQTVATLERDFACLDRARATLHTTIETLLDAPAGAVPRPGDAVESLPPLARCAGAVPPHAAPPPERAAAIAALDVELAKLDVYLLGGSPSVTLTEAQALRGRAEALAYPPQVFRAMLLAARVASWNGDTVSAETALRDTLIQADRAADDFTRAHAGALLAKLIADDRLVEATGLVAAARAALSRAGNDPAIEQAVLEAEVALATARSEPRVAAEIQNRIIVLARSRFGDDSPALVTAFIQLQKLWASAGDFAQATAAQRSAIEIIHRAGDPSVPADVQSLLGENLLDLVTVGDFVGAVNLGQQQLAALRGLPSHSLKLEAYTVGMVAVALELDGNCRSAIEMYREAEQLWSRPAAEFETVGEQVDPVAITHGVAESVFAHGLCLLTLGRATEAVTELRRALSLARAGGTATEDMVASISRGVGRALVMAGRPREGREVLEPMADQIATDPALKPLPRAMALFALAQAIWADGGTPDRPRALALADDADQSIALAITAGEQNLYLRKVPAQARALRVQVAAWRAAHQ